MAILGVLLLPSDFRAGSDVAHGHSLIQLWVDAADGRIDHHHATSATAPLALNAWFDPVVVIDPALEQPHTGGSPDLAEHQDSTPVPGGFHIFLSAFVLLPAAPLTRAPVPDPVRRLSGRAPRVLIPPPRPAPAGA